MVSLWKVLTRKKVIDPVSSEETRLNRVLNTFDLTALGVGSTLGVGVYVLAGHVAKDIAGPSVVLSFLIAAIASVFAGLCYAEFGARVPRAGSAYVYSYVCVGEFIAFVIGWNLILEYVIGSASVARGLTLYLDTLINNTLQNTFIEIAPINVPYLSSYFDFFSFGISVLLAVALAIGMKESSVVNNIFTLLNIGVVLFVVIAGSLKADPNNWRIQVNGTNTTENLGKGGFFPFGVEGMIKGAATCFYGFVGFDCIATTGEEVKNPKKAIPIAIILSLFIIFLAYFGTSTVVTLMVPYYLQDPNAPIPHAFASIGWEVAKWIVAIGGIFGLCASLFGAMFPLPRIIYAMGSDGIVFKFLAKVHPRFQTPLIGTILSGILTGLMAALFELKQLVSMMSIGTLLAYTIVAACVLLLRYTNEPKQRYLPIQTTSDVDESENSEVETYTDNKISINNSEDPMTSDEQELINTNCVTCWTVLGQVFNCSKQKNPTNLSENIVAVVVFLYCIMCVLIGLSAMYLKDAILNAEIWAIVLTSIAIGVAVILIMSLVTQPTSKKELTFKVPLVPLIPALSILVNIYLMLMLDLHTWIRFAVWMVLGIPMYLYSVRHCFVTVPQTVNSKTLVTNGNGTTNNHKLNGHTNVAFVHDDENLTSNAGDVRKKGLAPPPPKAKETMEIQQEAVIAQLDEILEKETLSIERKLSVDTVSNVSDIASPREENVVAVVHCDNVAGTPVIVHCDSVSNPANSLPNPVCVLVKKEDDIGLSSEETYENSATVKWKEKWGKENLDAIVIDLDSADDNGKSNKLIQTSSSCEEDKVKESSLEKSIIDQNQNLNGVNATEVEDSSKTPEIATKDLHAVIKTAEAEGTKQLKEDSSISAAPLPMTNKIDPTDSDPNIKKDILFPPTEETNLNKVNSSIPVLPIPASDQTDSSKELESSEILTEDLKSIIIKEDLPLTSEGKAFIPPPPMPTPDYEIDEVTFSIPRPTALSLKSVTLKKVQKIEDVVKNQEEVEGPISDENLKIGSDKSKSFMENLNDKLKRINVLPTYIPFVKKDALNVVKIEENKPNENVIEESINPEEVKLKFQGFIESRLNNNLEKDNKNNDEYHQVELNDASEDKNNDEYHQVELNDASEDRGEENNEERLKDHKTKMENVFHSINLKKVDSLGSIDEDGKPISKSLGSSFQKPDDKVVHRQKMDEIFKSIKLRRKQSTQEPQNKKE